MQCFVGGFEYLFQLHIFTVTGHGVASCAMFCDGEHIGQITASKDVSTLIPLQ